MASLTEAAHYTRKTIKWGTILIISLFILRALFQQARILYLRLNPPKPPPPTVAFGKLPSIRFPQKDGLPEITYELETIAGTLPTLADTGRVYFMPSDIYSYLTLERASAKARLLGFGTEPRQTPGASESDYQWRSGGLIPSLLKMNIVRQTFSLHYDYEKDQSLLGIDEIITPDQAVSRLKSFLTQAGFLPGDISQGEVKYLYYRYAPPDFIRVSSLSEVDFFRVNLLRRKIDNLDVLPANPYKANITGLVSKSLEPGKSILELDYNYFPLDTEHWATYPLRRITQAWSELKDGGGFVANLGGNQDGEITIRKVYLAYFDPPEHQNFMQPVFVFEGDHEFLGYVPAIIKKWLVKN